MSTIMDGATNIGHDVRIVFTSWNRHDRAGLLHEHPTGNGDERHVGGIMFDLPGVADNFPDKPLWTVEQWDSLTISPSIHCLDCGHHGWIRDGEWVPA